MWFKNLWTNFSNTIKTVGATINKHLPYILSGVKNVAHFVEQNVPFDAISKPAGLVKSLAESAQELHKYFNPTHPLYNQEEPFIPSVNEPASD